MLASLKARRDLSFQGRDLSWGDGAPGGAPRRQQMHDKLVLNSEQMTAESFQLMPAPSMFLFISQHRWKIRNLQKDERPLGRRFDSWETEMAHRISVSYQRKGYQRGEISLSQLVAKSVKVVAQGWEDISRQWKSETFQSLVIDMKRQKWCQTDTEAQMEQSQHQRWHSWFHCVSPTATGCGFSVLPNLCYLLMNSCQDDGATYVSLGNYSEGSWQTATPNLDTGAAFLSFMQHMA